MALPASIAAPAGAVAARAAAASDRLPAAMAGELRHLRTEMGETGNRTAVLERLATDPAARLDREIAGLSNNLN